jgi:hypothetical protein
MKRILSEVGVSKMGELQKLTLLVATVYLKTVRYKSQMKCFGLLEVRHSLFVLGLRFYKCGRKKCLSSNKGHLMETLVVIASG